MVIAVASSPSVYSFFHSTATQPFRFRGYFWTNNVCLSRLRLSVWSRLHSSKPSDAGGFLSPENSDIQYELQHGLSPQRRRGLPVFVKLPVDILNSSGQIRKRKAVAQSFRALAVAGVEGIVMEVWWGSVEKNMPEAYDWEGYLDIVSLARTSGLRVRAVMAFHQCGLRPGDPHWIPLPCWVCDQMDADSDLAYSDRLGRRNEGYISFGCDLLPVLHGRSPIQAYSDFMRNFRDTFKSFLGVTITGIQVGMGPCGELPYPPCSYEVPWVWESCNIGNTQYFDKYMIASLNAHVSEIRNNEWEVGVPKRSGSFMLYHGTGEFDMRYGTESKMHGSVLPEWYLKMILLHGERLCKEANSIFRGTKVNLSAKVHAAYWLCGVQSFPSAFSDANSYISIMDLYMPAIRMLGRHAITLSISCIRRDRLAGIPIDHGCSLEQFFEQIILGVGICGLQLEFEDFAASDFDDDPFQQVLKLSKLHSDGTGRPLFSFNLSRMDKSLFEYNNWVGFTRFVRQMSGANTFTAKLGTIEGYAHSTRIGTAHVYY